MDAYRRGVAAILKQLGQGADFCIGHKEYAPGRKPDPSFDMKAFRSAVAAIIAGTAPAPTLIPAAEPPVTPGAPPGRPTLRRGATGDLVKQIQAKLGVEQVGNFGPKLKPRYAFSNVLMDKSPTVLSDLKRGLPWMRHSPQLVAKTCWLLAPI